MKRFKRRAVFLATNLETLGMVPFFGSWPLQYKMLSVSPELEKKKHFKLGPLNLLEDNMNSIAKLRMSALTLELCLGSP